MTIIEKISSVRNIILFYRLNGSIGIETWDTDSCVSFHLPLLRSRTPVRALLSRNVTGYQVSGSSGHTLGSVS